MAKKLFVGSLSWGTTDDTLKDFFASAGNVVSATVIKDKISGRSRGFGFVEMSTDAEAEKAKSDLNGKDLDGRAIMVSEARERDDRGGSPAGGHQSSSKSDDDAPAADEEPKEEAQEEVKEEAQEEESKDEE